MRPVTADRVASGGGRRTAAVAGALLLAAATATAASAAQPQGDDRVDSLVVQVLEVHPHDTGAFTQGLLYFAGSLYESTGRYGLSLLRRLDAANGKELARVELPGDLFGEGLARLPGDGGGTLVQLTWQAGEALLWDAEKLERSGGFHYQGEGWGLCFDGARLVMSDGGDALVFRDPASFEETGRVTVTLRGQPVALLNELECAEGWVYANVLGANTILRIDPADGRVNATVDASGLLAAGEAASADVLNGIAYDPEAEVFYLTGKLWPKLFTARFVPRPPPAGR